MYADKMIFVVCVFVCGFLWLFTLVSYKDTQININKRLKTEHVTSVPKSQNLFWIRKNEVLQEGEKSVLQYRDLKAISYTMN